MRIVAVLKGRIYEQMAAITIPRAEKVLGQPVEVHRISGDVWDYKIGLLEQLNEPLLCIDIDLVFCSWDWDAFDLTRFCAVIDYKLADWAHGAPHFEALYPVRSAINAGLWYSPATDEAKQMFRIALALRHSTLKNFRYPMGDQTAINLSLHRTQLPVHFLPAGFNWQVSPGPREHFTPPKPPPGTHVVHLIGDTFEIDGHLPSPAHKLLRVSKTDKALPCPNTILKKR